MTRMCGDTPDCTAGKPLTFEASILAGTSGGGG